MGGNDRHEPHLHGAHVEERYGVGHFLGTRDVLGHESQDMVESYIFLHYNGVGVKSTHKVRLGISGCYRIRPMSGTL